MYPPPISFSLFPSYWRHAQAPGRRLLRSPGRVRHPPPEQEGGDDEEPTGRPEAQRGDAGGGGQEDDGQPRPREHHHVRPHRAQHGEGTTPATQSLFKPHGHRHANLRFDFVHMLLRIKLREFRAYIVCSAQLWCFFSMPFNRPVEYAFKVLIFFYLNHEPHVHESIHYIM